MGIDRPDRGRGLIRETRAVCYDYLLALGRATEADQHVIAMRRERDRRYQRKHRALKAGLPWNDDD